MQIDGLSKEEVVELEIPTGGVIIYRYERGSWFKEQ
jgi:bisphosphoglycerate-dependent phosphoglycerate mutase